MNSSQPSPHSPTATVKPAGFDYLDSIKRTEFRWNDPAGAPGHNTDLLRLRGTGALYYLGSWDEEIKPDAMFKTLMAKKLRDNWGVTTGEEALAVIKDLVLDGSYVETDLLIELATKVAGSADNREIEEFLAAFATANNRGPHTLQRKYDRVREMVTSESWDRIHPPASPNTTRAWNLMRIEAVAGTAFNVGLISKDEYIHAADASVYELQRTFSSWADAAGSYWWGRAVWLLEQLPDFGEESASEWEKEMTETHTELGNLLAHSDSPWIRVSLQP